MFRKMQPDGCSNGDGAQPAQHAQRDTTRLTKPTGNATMPPGDTTMPSGDATMPSGDENMPSGDATTPTGTIPNAHMPTGAATNTPLSDQPNMPSGDEPHTERDERTRHTHDTTTRTQRTYDRTHTHNNHDHRMSHERNWRRESPRDESRSRHGHESSRGRDSSRERRNVETTHMTEYHQPNMTPDMHGGYTQPNNQFNGYYNNQNRAFNGGYPQQMGNQMGGGGMSQQHMGQHPMSNPYHNMQQMMMPLSMMNNNMGQHGMMYPGTQMPFQPMMQPMMQPMTPQQQTPQKIVRASMSSVRDVRNDTRSRRRSRSRSRGRQSYSRSKSRSRSPSPHRRNYKKRTQHNDAKAMPMKYANKARDEALKMLEVLPPDVPYQVKNKPKNYLKADDYNIAQRYAKDKFDTGTYEYDRTTARNKVIPFTAINGLESGHNTIYAHVHKLHASLRAGKTSTSAQYLPYPREEITKLIKHLQLLSAEDQPEDYQTKYGKMLKDVQDKQIALQANCLVGTYQSYWNAKNMIYPMDTRDVRQIRKQPAVLMLSATKITKETRQAYKDGCTKGDIMSTGMSRTEITQKLIEIQPDLKTHFKIEESATELDQVPLYQSPKGERDRKEEDKMVTPKNKNKNATKDKGTKKRKLDKDKQEDMEDDSAGEEDDTQPTPPASNTRSQKR